MLTMAEVTEMIELFVHDEDERRKVLGVTRARRRDLKTSAGTRWKADGVNIKYHGKLGAGSKPADGKGKIEWGKDVDVNKKHGPSYDGTWKNATMDGRGIFYFADGCTYEGDFKDGERHGHGKFSFVPDYTLCSSDELSLTFEERGMVHDPKSAKATMIKALEDFDSEVRAGSRPGCEEFVVSDSYEGEYRFGLENGHGTYTWPRLGSWRGTFLDGKMTGKGVFTSLSGNSYFNYGWEKAEQHPFDVSKLVFKGAAYDGAFPEASESGEDLIPAMKSAEEHDVLFTQLDPQFEATLRASLRSAVDEDENVAIGWVRDMALNVASWLRHNATAACLGGSLFALYLIIVVVFVVCAWDMSETDSFHSEVCIGKKNGPLSCFFHSQPHELTNIFSRVHHTASRHNGQDHGRLQWWQRGFISRKEPSIHILFRVHSCCHSSLCASRVH